MSDDWKEVRLKNMPFYSARYGPVQRPAFRREAELDFMARNNKDTGKVEPFPYPVSRIRTREIRNIAEEGPSVISQENLDRFDLSPAQSYGFNADTQAGTMEPYPMMPFDATGFDPSSMRQKTPEMQELSDALMERLGPVDKAKIISDEPIDRLTAESSIAKPSLGELENKPATLDWWMTERAPREKSMTIIGRKRLKK